MTRVVGVEGTTTVALSERRSRVATISVVPTPLDVTSPVASTVATAGSRLLHATPVAGKGSPYWSVTSATNVAVVPAPGSSAEDGVTTRAAGAGTSPRISTVVGYPSAATCAPV